MLWLLASESKDGSFEASNDELAFRLRLNESDIEDGLKPLIEKGFFVEFEELEEIKTVDPDPDEKPIATDPLADASKVHTFAVPEGERETEGEGEREQTKKTQRGTRLPTDWEIPDDWKTEANEIRPDWNDQHLQRIADSFRDYWVGKSGKDATKVDWLATWRNWCRRDNTPIANVQPIQKPAKQRKLMPIPGRIPNHG